jgi:hypothetical protein
MALAHIKPAQVAIFSIANLALQPKLQRRAARPSVIRLLQPILPRL